MKSNTMDKTCNVVMLPTNEKASNIVKILKDTISYTTTENISGGNYQHLYITSNNEIKKDDWFIANQGVHQCIEVVAGDYPYKIANKYNNNEIQYQSKNWLGKKIIATTDTSLELPQPSKQFIQKYIEEYNKGNVITKVEVEHTYDNGEMFVPMNTQYLLINNDNTINIKPIKDSWSREEIMTLFRHFRTDMLPFGQVVDFELNSWIEKNL